MRKAKTRNPMMSYLPGSSLSERTRVRIEMSDDFRLLENWVSRLLRNLDALSMNPLSATKFAPVPFLEAGMESASEMASTRWAHLSERYDEETCGTWEGEVESLRRLHKGVNDWSFDEVKQFAPLRISNITSRPSGNRRDARSTPQAVLREVCGTEELCQERHSEGAWPALLRKFMKETTQERAAAHYEDCVRQQTTERWRRMRLSTRVLVFQTVLLQLRGSARKSLAWPSQSGPTRHLWWGAGMGFFHSCICFRDDPRKPS